MTETMGLIAAWLIGAFAVALLLGARLHGQTYDGIPPTLRVFFREVATVCAESPLGITLIGFSKQGPGLTLLWNDRLFDLPTDSLRQFYLDAGCGDREDSLRKRIRSELEQMDVEFRRVQALDRDRVLGEVLPRILRSDWILGHAASFGAFSPIRDPLFEELEICYVLDHGSSVEFLTEAHCELLSISRAELPAASSTNLHRRADLDELLPNGDEPVRIVRTADGFAAERLLLALEEDPGRVEGLVFSMPERGVLNVGRERRELVEIMREQREGDVAAQEPLSSRVFRIEGHALRDVEAGEPESARPALVSGRS